MIPHKTLRIAIVEDHVLVREGLVDFLGEQPAFVIAYAGARTAEVLALPVAPDLLLLDLDLDGTSASVDDAATLVTRGCKVLVVSALGSPKKVREMLRAGVAGLVPKRESTETMLAAIKVVIGGGHWTPPDLAAILANDDDVVRPELTVMERRALVLYASGLKLASVARRLEISPYTAKEYIDRVRQKYVSAGRPAPTKTDLYREAVRDGHIPEAREPRTNEQ